MRITHLLLGAGLLATIALGVYVAYLDHRITTTFEGRRWSLPARVFARPLELFAGRELSADELERELELLRYRETDGAQEPGTYQRTPGRLVLATRGFRFADDSEPARRLSLRFRGGTLTALSDADTARAVAIARLQPVLIANIYPAHRENRILLRREEVPDRLVQALVRVEDRNFYSHPGVDPMAVGRALLANLRAGAAVQGGSTLTQQLVKNVFLSNERSLWRKFQEALMALLLDWRYGKDEILTAYVNEVYLGQQGAHAVHGFGLASQFYFGRRLGELRADQLALLAGLVKGPSRYNPRRHPQRARERRNLVLDQLAEGGQLTRAQAARAARRPLGVRPSPPPARTPFPGYVDLVRQQLRRDYSEAALRSEGLLVFTSLAPVIQLHVEAVAHRHLARLEGQRGLPEGKLETAVVVTRVDDGEVLAVVGGRDVRLAGFNRALDARRPIGSLVKPVVYLEALSRPRAYSLATRVDDGPLRVRLEDGKVWSPENYDRKHHGKVPLLEALVHSYNVSSARLGLQLGLDAVVRRLHALGVDRRLEPYPALLLGAVELRPMTVAQIYQAIAAAGYRTPLKTIRQVMDRRGRILRRYPVTLRRAAEEGPVYLLTAALKRVTERGTARRLTDLLPEGLEVAGKTGTTDELHDSWFAGFSGEHLAVVWVGRDDNRPTGLTGASGAMPIWADVMAGIGTRALSPTRPQGVRWYRVDAEGTRRLPVGCDGGQRMPFLRGSGPPLRRHCGGLAGWSQTAPGD